MLRVALGEYDTGWHDPVASLERAAALVARAAAAGAHLVVLPEMATTGFTMDAAAQATPLDGAVVGTLRDLARTHAVSLLAGVALAESAGMGDTCATNAALLVSPTGELTATYRKQRLFAFADEDATYRPGTSAVIATVEGVRLAPFICYDLRFPELFRAVASRIDLLVVIANWPAARRAHWDALVRARAIENLAYVVAVNRTGTGGGLTYDGGSVAYDPWGEPLPAVAGGDGGGEMPCIVEIDPERVAAVRGRYPFLADV